jgi:NTE family protein
MNMHKKSSLKNIINFPWFIFAIIFLSSCATYPANTPTTQIQPDKGYRFDTLAKGDNSEDLFVILTFSGGGTRAAALSYGVMEKLRSTKIFWNGKEKTLLDEVDVISSVSGGSFTSAYYGLFREKLFSKGDDGFEKRFLYRNIQRDLEMMLFNPINWFKLASPTFGRIDMAAEFYNEEIFANKKFETLKDNGLPFLIINSTEMTGGTPFSFVQSQFDLLCSNLGEFGVARAVAASSDFPVAFTPLQINNYADRCKYDKPKWMKMAAMDRDFRFNPGRTNRALKEWSFRDETKRPWIHLLDGGIADNIGLRVPLTSLSSGDIAWSVLNKVNNKKIKKIVVIVVDAKTQGKNKIGKSQSPPGLIKVLETVSTVPLDNYSFDTINLLKVRFKQWQKDRQSLWKDDQTTFKNCPPEPDNATPEDLKPLDLYAIYIGFDQIADGQEFQGHKRDWYLDLPTSFYLPADTVDSLRGVANDLLETSDPFKDLRSCLN